MELPIEILHIIALDSPAAYLAMVQTCKAMSIPTAMNHFTTRRIETNMGYVKNILGVAWRLPNGELHSPVDLLTNGAHDVPAIEYYDGNHEVKEWYHRGKLHRDNDLPAAYNENENGYIYKWYQHGELHRDGDQPAIIDDEEVQMWYQHNQLHRDNDQPAIVDTLGFQEWYRHGQRHRDGDLPAYICTDATDIEYHEIVCGENLELPKDIEEIVASDRFQIWYNHGLVHRENDMPAIVDDAGNYWYQYGKLHRDNDQPAIEMVSHEAWYQHGLLHRENDDPAVVVNIDHHKFELMWYKDGVKYFPVDSDGQPLSDIYCIDNN
jgi:hypothetical protein